MCDYSLQNVKTRPTKICDCADGGQRAMADGGSTVLQLPVPQMMTRNVSTCDVNKSIDNVMDRMMKGKFRHMPVLDTDRLVGLVSIGDALKWQIENRNDTRTCASVRGLSC